MKFHFFHLTALALLSSMGLFAQSKPSIIDDLNAPKQGQGMVKVYIDDNIKNLIGTPAESATSNRAANDTLTGSTRSATNFIKRPGFKIQVFSGNNQRKSKDEAYYKQAQIRNNFPDIETSVSFHSPFWRLRAGNYKSYAEASQAMGELKKAFPSFGKEMYIVKDEIAIPIE
jgi:hypothetical protein